MGAKRSQRAVRAEYPRAMHARRTAETDALLYAGAAVTSGIVALAAGIPLLREWGRLSAPAYVGGAGIAVWLAVRPGKRQPDSVLRWLALAVLIGAGLLPLGLEARWRASTGPGLHAQSEAIVTEEAARAFRRGIDPYAAEYLHGPLEARPLGTKTHFPYLPAMLVFGLPRAFDGSSSLADSRLGFAGFTLGLAAVVLGRPRLRQVAPRHRRSLLLVLSVLPTGALFMATGGDDLPVLAVMLLALVLAEEGKPVAGGVAAGLAAITKQTAWILLPFLAMAARDREGGPARWRFSVTSAAVVTAGVLPFFAWNPGDFVEDVIRFPLGLGRQRSAAGTPTLGGGLIRVLPSQRVPLTVVLVCLILAVAAFILVKRPPSTTAAAAKDTGLVFLMGILLTPAVRFGYVVYPINLFVWAWVLRAARDPTVAPAPETPSAGGTVAAAGETR
jgi:glycosyl transferase family 87